MLRKHLRILFKHFSRCHNGTIQKLGDGTADCLDRWLRNPGRAECIFEALVCCEEDAGRGYRDENDRADALVKPTIESAVGDGRRTLVGLLI